MAHLFMSYVGLTGHEKPCRDPGSSRGPSDLQSDALPTELSRLCHKIEINYQLALSQAFLAIPF